MGVVSGIFTYESDQSHARECQENKAGYLQPELMEHSSEVAPSCFRPAQDRPIGARSLDLLACDPCCDP